MLDASSPPVAISGADCVLATLRSCRAFAVGEERGRGSDARVVLVPLAELRVCPKGACDGAGEIVAIGIDNDGGLLLDGLVRRVGAADKLGKMALMRWKYV